MSLLLVLLIGLVIAGFAWWAVQQIAAAFGLPAPVVVVVRVLIVGYALWWLLQRMPGGPWG